MARDFDGFIIFLLIGGPVASLWTLASQSFAVVRELLRQTALAAIGGAIWFFFGRRLV